MNRPFKKLTSGGWIFVCHSHRDLEKVRPARNELERGGTNYRRQVESRRVPIRRSAASD